MWFVVGEAVRLGDHLVSRDVQGTLGDRFTQHVELVLITLDGLCCRHGLEVRLHGEHRIGNNLHIIIRQCLATQQMHAGCRMPGLAALAFFSGIIGSILGDPLGPAVRRALADDAHGIATFAVVAELAAVRPEVETPRRCGLVETAINGREFGTRVSISIPLFHQQLIGGDALRRQLRHLARGFSFVRFPVLCNAWHCVLRRRTS
mmetsp:Transcript_40582/g.70233  ORF Transcript_40582/g.70233 Transcript_40582/m.70233 type:complete len:205 (+) Transcript_40582:522-1136(+)